MEGKIMETTWSAVRRLVANDVPCKYALARMTDGEVADVSGARERRERFLQ